MQAFQTELRARYSTMPGLESLFERGIRVAKEAGGRKKKSRSRKFVFDLGTRNKAGQEEEKPRQANTSQGQPPRADGLQ